MGLTGIFLIVASVMFFIKPNLAFPANRKLLILGGGLSGFIVGLVGTGGALRAAFLTGLNMEKEKYIGTSAVVALGSDATRIPYYISSGFLPEQYYFLIPFLFTSAITGSYVGRKMVARIDQQKFKKMVLIAIILVRVKFILDGIIMLMT